MNKKTILLYGRTRSGKSTLIGELAEAVYARMGKKTLLYTSDRGGFDPILPYIQLGIIETCEMASTDPWMFSRHSSSGDVKVDGKWAKLDLSKYGLVAFESMTSLADSLMVNLAERSAAGESFGGAANVSFKAEENGEVLKIGGANMAHYNIVQSRVTADVWASQKLDVPYVLWTANVSKDEDAVGSTKVLGPEVVGKKLTSEVPRWFNLTFRLDCTPAAAGKPEQHILFLGNSQDLQAGNAISLGNTRTPLDSTPLATSIKPASLVKALDMIEEKQGEALAKIRTRMGMKG